MKRPVLYLLLTIIAQMAYSRHYDLTVQRISTADGLPTNIVSRIWQDKTGFMWFETRSGMCRYDGYQIQMFSDDDSMKAKKSERLTTRDAEWRREGKGRLARHGKDGSHRSWQLIEETIVDYTRNDHFHVADVDERTEAISTYGGGLYLYDKPTGELTRIDQGKISNPYLTYLYVDRTGCIWVAEDYLGVTCLRLNRLNYQRHQIEPEPRILDENNVRHMIMPGSGQLLLSNQTGGLFLYRIAEGQASVIRRLNHRAYAILKDKDGQLWIGTRGGGLLHGQQRIEGLPSNDIFAITEDGKGGLWIAMLKGGIGHMNSKGTLELFLEGKDCHDIKRDAKGQWWVAAEDSLYIIDVRGKQKKVKAVADGYFVCLCPDSAGKMWAGSVGKGLMDCQSKKYYTTTNGLTNNNVYAIVEDSSGYIWAGTEEGLSCLNPVTGDMQNYHFTDSRLSNVFNERAAVCMKDGRLFFGTHDGIIEIVSERVKTENNSPQTAITEASANDRLGSLTFTFSNFQYALLSSVLYQYRLDGIDEEWSYPTKEHTAIYRNLPPGEYTFHVRSNNGNGVWGKVCTATLRISPPWWNTWWAWCMYACLAAALCWLIVRAIRLRQSLNVERRVSAFQKDFYDRIERELRNPVNILQGAAENVQLSGTSKTTVQSLRRGSKRMLKLMDMLREFHSLNDIQKKVQAERDSMNEETERRFLDIRQTIHNQEEDFREMTPPPANEQFILIVEDDEDNMTHLRDTLSPLFRIIECRQANDCEDMIQHQKPHTVLIDITADEKQARSLTKIIRDKYQDIPVIHLSSFSDNAHQLSSLRAGACDYIIKPFSGKILIERIKKALQSPAKSVPPTAATTETPSTEVLTDVKDRKFLERFQHIMTAHVGEENFSVEQCAELMNLGRTQLYKRVKALTGETPIQHLHRARIEYAAQLLRESNATVENVMLRTGFHSPTHFYNAFKKHFGMSPKEYARMKG
ncbi:MAG: helix-turn-helix domain-containing protein [Prevotella sp.]|nr:helix-turn-helix domain-containing protein [Prevotella sp.]